MMEDMEQTTTTESSSPPRGSDLVRPVHGRMVAGVAMGLANRLELPEWVVRVAFLVAAFLGGLGLVLYAAGWALIRSEDETESAAERFFSRAGTVKSWLGIGLIAVAVIIVLGEYSIFSQRVTLAATLLVVGILLYTGVISPQQGEASERAEAGTDDAESASVSLSERPSIQSVAKSRPVVAPTPPAPRPPRERSYLGRIAIGVAMLAVGILAILDIAPLAFNPRPRHYLALVVVVIGAALMVGAFRGRARGLILVAMVLVPFLFFSPLLEARVGDASVSFNPTSFDDLRPSYSTSIGELNLDLTSLPWDGELVRVALTGDAARISVWVPSGVAVRGRLAVEAGWMSTPWGGAAGIGGQVIDLDHDGEGWGTLDIDARVDMGTIDLMSIHMQREEQQP